MSLLIKGYRDTLDYEVDFARWLPDGDIIAQATAEITGSTAIITQVSTSQTTAVVWIAGGAIGDTAEITVTVRTQVGRIKTASFKLRMKEVE